MSEKRRDTKGRLLRNGESQLSDGRYRFSYYEGDKQKNFYSWKLVKTDKLPTGKRECIALRDKEEEYQDYIRRNGSNASYSMTIKDIVDRYMMIKVVSVKEPTKYRYKGMLNVLYADDFVDKQIKDLKVSDCKQWVVSLYNDGKKYNTISNYINIIKPAFELAIEDEIIVKNPFSFTLSKVIKNTTEGKEAFTEQQRDDILEFVKNDKHLSKYYEGLYILFFTGIRISEFCAITKDDIGLKNNTLNINKQLFYNPKDTDNRFHIITPKSKDGNRILPISDKVKECFKTLIDRYKDKKNVEIDGVKNLFYITKKDTPMYNVTWCSTISNIIEKYRKHVDPTFPNLTPHICRHTYCTVMAMKGMNPKILQYLMGHSSIKITLDVYTNATFRDVSEEVKRVHASV